MHHGNRHRASLLSTKTTTSDKKDDGDDADANEFEWNGLDDAKISLSSSKGNTKTKEVSANDELESKKNKKRKKKDEKRKIKCDNGDDEKGAMSLHLKMIRKKTAKEGKN